MKKVGLLFIPLVLTAISVAISCNKKIVYSPPVQTITWTSGLRSTPQTYTVIAGRDTVIMGKDSTVMHFYPNSFKLATGNIITSGSISIQLIEMYMPGVMIANGATTTVMDGTLLQSGGQVYIKATMNGQEVFANKYGLGFRHPGSSNQPMEIFYGSLGNVDSTVQWTISDTSKTGSAASGTTTDSSISTATDPHPSFMYIFDSCTSFDWVNCDHFMGNGANDKIFFQLPDDSYSNTNTVVYLTLTETNSVEKAEYSGGGKFLIAHLPGGVPYKTVAITNKDNMYYYCEQIGTTTVTHAVITVPMAMAPETLGDIIARLRGL